MLFTIEGIDGSGKSSVVKGLRTRLADLNPVFTREPTSSEVGTLLRKTINEGNAWKNVFLFAADHQEHIQTTIHQALQNHTLTISDRYLHSHLAYQSIELAGEKDHGKALDYLQSLYNPIVWPPDYTFWIDVNPEIAVARLASRGSRDAYENVEHLSRVQDVYRDLWEDQAYSMLGIERIDGDRPLTTITNEIAERIRTIYNTVEKNRGVIL